MENETVKISEPASLESDHPTEIPDEAPEQAPEKKPTPKKKHVRTYLMTGGIVAIIGLIIAAAALLPSYFSYAKSISDLKLNLINQDMRNVVSIDTLRIGADNESDDDKYLTKAVVHVTAIRNDDTPVFFSLSYLSENGVNINICNIGWGDLKNVLIEADPDVDSYQNLKHPEKFTLKLETMQCGHPYVAGELTLDDLKDPTAFSSIPLRYKIQGEKEYYKTICPFSYHAATNSFAQLPDGKGGVTPVSNIEYRIQCDEGVGEYTLPLEYVCPAHKYEEINFTITADRSCDVSYYIELYAMDKLMLTTEERGAHFTIRSFDLYSVTNDPTR